MFFDGVGVWQWHRRAAVDDDHIWGRCRPVGDGWLAVFFGVVNVDLGFWAHKHQRVVAQAEVGAVIAAVGVPPNVFVAGSDFRDDSVAQVDS